MHCYDDYFNTTNCEGGRVGAIPTTTFSATINLLTIIQLRHHIRPKALADFAFSDCFLSRRERLPAALYDEVVGAPMACGCFRDGHLPTTDSAFHHGGRLSTPTIDREAIRIEPSSSASSTEHWRSPMRLVWSNSKRQRLGVHRRSTPNSLHLRRSHYCMVNIAIF